MYRAARDAGAPKVKTTRGAEPVEWGTTEQLLAGIFLLMQQQIHATYVARTKAARKKPKLAPWPGPKTAEALVRAEDIRATFHHLEDNVIRRVSREQYEATISVAVDHREMEADDTADEVRAVSFNPAELARRLAGASFDMGPSE